MDRTFVHGLVFDLDNTLLDRETAFISVAEDFYDECLRAVVSATRDDVVTMMVRWDADGYASREGMLKQWLNEWPDIGMSLEALMEWFLSAMERRVEPDHEVNEFLAQLNDLRVPWGIVTNGRTSQHGKCKAAGLDKLASFIIVSDEAGYAKPDTRIFRDALKATGLTTPDQVMFVGDNPLADIDGAKRFGMKAAWIRRGRQYPADLQPPDYVIDFVTEVRNIVRVTL